MTDNKAGCLLKESTGVLWYLYLENQRLHYVRKQDKVWTSPEIIDCFTFKLYVTAVVPNNKIYVLAYTCSKQLWLYEWSNSKWNRTDIKSISSKYENITYISLKYVSGRLHLLFYIHNSLQKARVSLKHYVLDKNVFKALDSLNYFSDDNVTPLSINNDHNGNIYLFYKKQFSNAACLYISIYSNHKGGWSKQCILLKRLKSIKIFDSKVDKSGDLHLLWTEISHSKTTLLYKKVSRDDIGFSASSREVVLCTTSNTIKYLSLLVSDFISAYWMDQSRGFYIFINESTIDKNDIRVIDYSPVNPYFITTNNHIDNNPVLIIGDGFPAFKWDILSIINSDTYSNNELVQHIVKNNRTLNDWMTRLEKFEQTVDGLYNGLQQLYEHIKEKDKSIHQLGIQIKQLSFELEHIRKKRATDRNLKQQKNKNSSINENKLIADRNTLINSNECYAIREASEDEVQLNDNKDKFDYESEEIALEKVTIVINPKEESE